MEFSYGILYMEISMEFLYGNLYGIYGISLSENERKMRKVFKKMMM